MTETFALPVEGGHLHVEALGPEDAPRVVMLHGALAVGRSMLSQAVALKRDHRVFLVDQRGHGGSSRLGTSENPWERLTMERLVADGEAVVDALRPDALVGVSMGGIVSGHLASRRPDRVNALALLSTAPRETPGRRAYFSNARPDTFPEGQRALWARWHGDDYWHDLAAHVFEAFGARRPDDYPKQRLRAYSGPALVLAGEDDELVAAEEAEAYREWLPQVEVHVLPGDHAFFAGAGRREANEALREFLTGALG